MRLIGLEGGREKIMESMRESLRKGKLRDEY